MHTLSQTIKICSCNWDFTLWMPGNSLWTTGDLLDKFVALLDKL